MIASILMKHMEYNHPHLIFLSYILMLMLFLQLIMNGQFDQDKRVRELIKEDIYIL